MTDPVQEARAGVWSEYQRLRVDGYGLAGEEAHDAALDAYAAAIRREEAARVLPVLRAVEWPDCLCAACAQHDDEGHAGDCALAAEITRLEALVKEGEDD